MAKLETNQLIDSTRSISASSWGSNPSNKNTAAGWQHYKRLLLSRITPTAIVAMAAMAAAGCFFKLRFRSWSSVSLSAQQRLFLVINVARLDANFQCDLWRWYVLVSISPHSILSNDQMPISFTPLQSARDLSSSDHRNTILFVRIYV